MSYVRFAGFTKLTCMRLISDLVGANNIIEIGVRMVMRDLL